MFILIKKTHTDEWHDIPKEDIDDPKQEVNEGRVEGSFQWRYEGIWEAQFGNPKNYDLDIRAH